MKISFLFTAVALVVVSLSGFSNATIIRTRFACGRARGGEWVANKGLCLCRSKFAWMRIGESCPPPRARTAPKPPPPVVYVRTGPPGGNNGDNICRGLGGMAWRSFCYCAAIRNYLTRGQVCGKPKPPPVPAAVTTTTTPPGSLGRCGSYKNRGGQVLAGECLPESQGCTTGGGFKSWYCMGKGAKVKCCPDAPGQGRARVAATVTAAPVVVANAGQNTAGGLNSQPSNGKLSPQMLNLIKSYEGLGLCPYSDQTVGFARIRSWSRHATIGYGHLIKNANEFRRFSGCISQAQADQIFAQDMQKFESEVTKVITKPLKQREFDALVSLCFNIGPGNFRSSSIKKLVNGEPGCSSCCCTKEKALRSFRKASGRVLAGLEARRFAEWRVFSEGVYEKVSRVPANRRINYGK